MLLRRSRGTVVLPSKTITISLLAQVYMGFQRDLVPLAGVVGTASPNISDMVL